MLPSEKTVAARIDAAVDEGQLKLRELSGIIAAVTMDFASKDVDYLVITGHWITNQWYSIFCKI